MDAQQFVAEFGHIANAPGGVARLREMVLHFAISGQLTERCVDDIPAEALIEENRNRQKLLVNQGALKRQPEPKPVANGDRPWELPNGWMWTRLGSVTNYGDAPKVEFGEVKEDTWVLELEDIEKESSRLLAIITARERKFKSTKNGFPAGAILYGKLRPYLDKVLISDAPGVCTTEINPISFFHNIDARYLRWYLKSRYFIAYADGSTYGMNLPRLGTDSAREALFSFPPKTEQTRIVAKVDELMALCDKLEAQQQERESRKTVLAQALIARFAEEPTQDNLHSLFQSSRVITPADLRKAILTLAVHGKLLRQDIKDGPVSEVLAEGVELPNGHVRRRKIMKRAPIASNADLFPELPPSWEYATVQSLYDLNLIVDYADGNHGSLYPRSSEFGDSGITFVSARDISGGRVAWDRCALLNENRAHQLTKGWAKGGDVLLTHNATVGRVARVEREVGKFLLGTSVTFYRLNEEFIHPGYFYHVFCSPMWQRQLEAIMQQTTRNQVSIQKQAFFQVPIPPLSEQCRLVAKVDEFMALVDKLESRIATAHTTGKRMAEATVAALTGTTTSDDKDLTVKAPPTELIANLRLNQLPDVKQQAPLATILARHQGSMAVRDLWQRFGGDIDSFYAQLKIEVDKHWIQEPAVAEMRIKPAVATDA